MKFGNRERKEKEGSSRETEKVRSGRSALNKRWQNFPKYTSRGVFGFSREHLLQGIILGHE